MELNQTDWRPQGTVEIIAGRDLLATARGNINRIVLSSMCQHAPTRYPDLFCID